MVIHRWLYGLPQFALNPDVRLLSPSASADVSDIAVHSTGSTTSAVALRLLAATTGAGKTFGASFSPGTRSALTARSKAALSRLAKSTTCTSSPMAEHGSILPTAARCVRHVTPGAR